MNKLHSMLAIVLITIIIIGCGNKQHDKELVKPQLGFLEEYKPEIEYKTDDEGNKLLHLNSAHLLMDNGSFSCWFSYHDMKVLASYSMSITKNTNDNIVTKYLTLMADSVKFNKRKFIVYDNYIKTLDGKLYNYENMVVEISRSEMDKIIKAKIFKIVFHNNGPDLVVAIPDALKNGITELGKSVALYTK